MNIILSILIIISSGAAVISLGYFAVRQLVEVFGDDYKSPPIENHYQTELCDCEAGAGKKERYYHAVNCRYRQFLERET
ncbi:MAG: hypothetical protein PVF83_09640 [Anaerolineales bacterium]|jgi:hypothetical protein